jgi:uncharacterized protein YraI
MFAASKPGIGLRAILTCSVLIVMGLALSVQAQQVPFIAEATEGDVKLRSGVGHSYYVVGSLKQGQQVRVNEVLFGWYKIQPPGNVYSYISQGYVDAKGDGSRGIVNQSQAEVMAANVKGPGRSLSEQTYLDQGTEVRIVAREGSYYKIRPPEKAYVYAPPQSLNRLRGVSQGGEQQAADSSDQSNAGAADDEAQNTADAAESETDQASQAGGETSNSDSTDATVSEAAEQSSQTGAGSANANQNAGGSQSPADSSEASASSSSRMQLAQAESGNEDAAAAATRTNAEGDDAGGNDQSANDDQPDNEDAGQADGNEQNSSTAATQPSDDTEAQAGDLDAMKGGSVQTQAVSDKLRQVEQKMLPLFNQPLEQQPLEKMIQRYQELQQQDLPGVDQRIVRARLAALKRNKELAQALNQIDQVQQQTEKQKAAEQAAADSEPEVLPRAQYDAVGELVASSVYDGDNLPRMFRLVEPASGYTVGYVEPADVDAQRALGQVIGIVGTKSYDSAMRLRIFDVERLDVLEPASSEN